MAQTIKLKRSSVAGNVPGSSDLSLGEIALNTADGAVYIKKGNNDIVAVADNDILHIDTTNSRVGLGTTSPSSVLHVIGGSATIPTLSTSHPFTISNNGNSGMSIISSGTTNAGQVVFGDADDADIGRLRYDHSDDSMRFLTNASEQARIDSSGNLLVGKTNTTLGSAGIENRADGRITSTRSGNTNLVLNRLSSDGSLIDFYKDGTTVGAIKIFGSQLYIENTSDKSGLRLETNAILPRKNQAMANGTVGLGNSTYRFSTLYLSGTANVGGLNINSAYTFPTADGSANQVLQTDGSGNLTFGTAAGGGVSISNNVNNRVLTGDGTNANAEANLTFDGSTLGVTGTISSGAITSSGTLKSTNATGLILDTGAGYRDVQFVLTGNTGNGTLEIIPMTVPGSGTASYTTHFKNLVATGTTRHDLKVDGNATFTGTISSGAITSTGDTSITGNLSTTGGITVGDSSADALRFVGVLKQGSGSGTTVMDASRNLTNIGTISGTGISTGANLISLFSNQNGVNELKLTNNRQDLGNVAISKVSGYNGSEVTNMTFYRGSGGAAGYTKFQTKYNNAASLTDMFQIGANTDAYGVDVLSGGYRVAGTTVIDSSGNLTNIGTISSGAITSTGAIQGASFSDGTISGITFIDEDSFSTNSATRVPTQQSIKAYVDAQVAGVVDTAPAALNTLNELAAALGDDASFSTTTSTALGNRLRVDTASQGLTGTQQANAITNLGITATKAELNYVDGVTSNIQTQLNTKLTSSSSAVTNKLPLAGGTLTGALVGTTATFFKDATAGTNALNILGVNNGNGTGITFSDNGTPGASASGQNGYFTYYHGDSQSYGSGNAFILSSSETTTTILADGKLMYKEGIYSKPATGTGAGTRKDANWDTAYGWGNHASAGYITSFDITTQTDSKYLRSDADDTYGNHTLTIQGSVRSTNNVNTSGPNFNVSTTNKSTSEYAYRVDRSGSVVGGVRIDGRLIGPDAVIGGATVSAAAIGNWNTAYGWGNHASAGYITGNQTITLSGDVSGSGTTSITVTVADDSHNHIISNVDGLQTALDAKLASSSYTAADVLTKIKTVDGAGSGLDADLLDGHQLTTASTASTVVERDASGDINCRLLRSEYDTTNSSIGYIMTQVDTATNNYVRPSTPAQLRSALNVENGATADQTQSDINALGITQVGTISSGTWQGTAIASAYLDSDTAHLSGTQTFTGNKTFSGSTTLSGGVSLSNSNISNVNALSFADPGPNEGVSWSNIKIYESPDDLTTNSAGNFQVVYGSTRRLTVTNTGVDVNGTLTATAKSFDIEHPSKKGMRLKHGVVEGPEHSVYVRGKSKEKVILLPDYWVDLIHEDTITVQLTAIGGGQNLYVEDIKDNKVFVNGDNYFYYIQAERKDVERFEVEYGNSV